VVDEVLRRIASGDPAIWIEVDDPRALAEAAAALGPIPDPSRSLWGIPFAVKDNSDVAGRPTTGALPGRDRPALVSATVVARLLAAGALYVGKTNLDQLATGLVGTRSPYGTPRNPIDPSLVPGGSSSGSAVAVACRQVAFALGTDTAGSGRVPAALCGVVGLKGAPGSRPLDGVLPASPSIDCVSTFTGSLADGLAVEAVLGGAPWPVARGPLRIATTDEGTAIDLRLAGHSVVGVDLGPFHRAGDLLYGGPWLAERTATLQPLLAAHPDRVDPTVRTVIGKGAAYTGVEVFEARHELEAIRRHLEPWWAMVDALVVPTIDHAPTLAEVAADPIGENLRLGRNTTFANLLGLAAIAVPAPTGVGGVTVLGPASHAGAIAAVASVLAREPLPATATAGWHEVAVVGAHLSGQPLNHQLVERGGVLVETTRSAERYRLYELAGAPPRRPALERVDGRGASIEVEVWALDDAGLGGLTAAVAPPLGIGSIELVGGRWVHGFICEPAGLASAIDITSTGGWRAHLGMSAT
jgi:allophanate hydrolase